MCPRDLYVFFTLIFSSVSRVAKDLRTVDVIFYQTKFFFLFIHALCLSVPDTSGTVAASSDGQHEGRFSVLVLYSNKTLDRSTVNVELNFFVLFNGTYSGVRFFAGSAAIFGLCFCHVLFLLSNNANVQDCCVILLGE
jgi:hypothetical protein